MKNQADIIMIEVLIDAVDNNSVITGNTDKIDTLLEQYEFPIDILQACLVQAKNMNNLKVVGKIEQILSIEGSK